MFEKEIYIDRFLEKESEHYLQIRKKVKHHYKELHKYENDLN